MNNLIIPVGGLSTRFPNLRPKWLLTHPNGNFMFIEAMKDLNLSFFDNVYLICIKSVLAQYKCEKGIYDQVESLKKVKNFKLIVLNEQTKNQPETIYRGIVKEGIVGSVCIKDCDNYFRFSANGGNFVAYADLDDFDNVNAANKSYIVKNKDGVITNIVEKQIISKHFSSGCYGFKKAEEYVKYFEKMKDEDGLYVSHIIYKMMLDNIKFKAEKCFGYLDWGTLTDWSIYTRQFATLFVDVDGVVVNNSAEFFEPTWGDTGPIERNVECLNQLYETGKIKIVLVTSRNNYAKKVTLNQLKKIGLKYHDIIFGMLHAKRIIINDYSNSNPYRSCDAVNIKRDADELPELLSSLLGVNKCQKH